MPSNGKDVVGKQPSLLQAKVRAPHEATKVAICLDFLNCFVVIAFF